MKKAKLLMAMMLISCLASCNGNSNLNSTDSQDEGSTSGSSQSEVASSEASTSNQSEGSSQGETTSSEVSSDSQSGGSSQGSTSDATVSESEWQEIFDGFTTTNATCTRVVGTSTMSLKVESENKVHLITNDTKDDNSYAENILDKEGNNYYIYARANSTDKFTRTSVDETTFTSRVNSSAGPVLQINQMFESYELKGMYENFDFDDAQGAYVATISYTPVPTVTTTVDLVIKFADKNLTYVSVNTPQASSDGTSGTMEYSDFGTTTVTIPTDFNENSDDDTANKITETEWQEIFDGFTIINGTLISHANYEGSGIVMTVEAETPTKIHLISSTTFGDRESYEENILYKDGDDYYIYARENSEDKYTRTSVDEETFNNRLNSSASPLLALSAQLEMLQIKDNFEQFTYDNAQKAYVGTLVAPAQYNEMTLNFVIKFENNSLVSLVCASEDNTSVSTYSNFGTTTVDLPAEFN